MFPEYFSLAEDLWIQWTLDLSGTDTNLLLLTEWFIGWQYSNLTQFLFSLFLFHLVTLIEDVLNVPHIISAQSGYCSGITNSAD